MSRSGEITLAWGDEDRTFRLGIREWEKVQEKCDAGPAEILARLAPAFIALQQGLSPQQVISAGYLGTWRVHDVREPLYQGLIGAGKNPNEAGKIVRDLVDERPLIESMAIAYQVVLASVTGAEDEPPPGEPEGEAKMASPEESSPSQPTTDQDRLSA